MGHFGARRRCGACGEPFHRTHLWCVLDPDDPPIASLIRCRLSFYHNPLDVECPAVWLSRSPHFSCIDAGLCAGLFSFVAYALLRLETSLSSLPLLSRAPAAHLRSSSLPL